MDPIPSQESTAPPSDALVGRVVADRYRIISLIARGAMGEVYKAEQLQLGRLVALKILKPRPTKKENDEIRARFLREAAGLARLTHHNTVRILDFGVLRELRSGEEDQEDAIEERPYLVMELVNGRTLRTLLRGGPLPPQRALRIASQIAASLREAHQEGLLHRDLKPSNILVAVDADGNDLVKVIDFGLVKDLGSTEEEADLTAVGLVIGTPLYVPPEVVIGNPVDARADVYGVGVLLYQMLAGKPPFPEHGEIADILRRVVVLDVPPLRSVPGAGEVPELVEWVVQRCMDKQPAKRFRDAHQVLIALRAADQVLAAPELAVASFGLEDGVVVLPDHLSGSASHNALSRSLLSQGSMAQAAPSQETLVPGAPTQPAPRWPWALAGVAVLLLLAWLGLRAAAPPVEGLPPAAPAPTPAAATPPPRVAEPPPPPPAEAPPPPAAAATEDRPKEETRPAEAKAPKAAPPVKPAPKAPVRADPAPPPPKQPEPTPAAAPAPPAPAAPKPTPRKDDLKNPFE
jgi:serine/threonine protein kinase